MYAAQNKASMAQSVDFDKAIQSEDLFNTARYRKHLEERYLLLVLI
ncbi:hypothetical protein D104_02045 [Marinomonas profundimaris]|uniref:Uncharacterized protein n=1 Tax=Marinomonas profundimaris TaxID=1208321 RepID=W1S0N4_9GAMM|nr:hypothetical protein D104_02045 [Marinomonas profundimaris]